MGNCQAVDAAALVIQHPNGKAERMYWPVKANEVMKLNPGHYVSLIIPLPVHENEPATTTTTTTTNNNVDRKKTVRYTRVKLLKPTDTLALGHAYRLLTSQEVKKVIRAKKLAKAKMSELVSDRLQVNQGNEIKEKKLETETDDQGTNQLERQKLRSGSMNSRSKTWRPSLQSISEAAGS